MANFKPTEESIRSLNEITKELEEKIKPFLDANKELLDVSLTVLAKDNKGSTDWSYDPFDDRWYGRYADLLRECELKLTISVKGGMLRKKRYESYARIKINPFPACCGICVLNSLELHNDIRGAGLGKVFVKVAEAFAKVLNYSYIMCTTHKVNGPAIDIVDRLGYDELGHNFVNARTRNSIRMFGKNINPDDKALTDGYLELKDKS